MYVDFDYYRGTYGGSVLNEQAFPGAVREAESYIRYLTCLNGDIFADTAQADAVKGAVCAAAEAGYSARREQELGGNLKSESKDGLSMSFAVARKDGETADQYIQRCMYPVIRIRLLPTGWLSRRGKVGCVHDNQCGRRNDL